MSSIADKVKKLLPAGKGSADADGAATDLDNPDTIQGPEDRTVLLHRDEGPDTIMSLEPEPIVTPAVEPSTEAEPVAASSVMPIPVNDQAVAAEPAPPPVATVAPARTDLARRQRLLTLVNEMIIVSDQDVMVPEGQGSVLRPAEMPPAATPASW